MSLTANKLMVKRPKDLLDNNKNMAFEATAPVQTHGVLIKNTCQKKARFFLLF